MKDNRKIKRKTIDFNGEKIYLSIARYESNNRLAILSETKEEYYSDVTINLPEVSLDIDSLVAINNDCKKVGLEKKLIEENIISSIVGCMQYNYGVYDIAWINLENLYEYDPEGFKKELSDKMLIVENEKDDELEAE